MTHLLPHETKAYFEYLIKTTPIPTRFSDIEKLQIMIGSNINRSNPRSTILDMEQTQSVRRKNVKKIINIVCDAMGIDKAEFLTAKTRRRELYIPRQFVYYFSRKYTGIDLKRLAKLTYAGIKNPYDHSTIVHACHACQNDIDLKLAKHDFYRNYLKLALIFKQEFETV